MRTKKGNTTVHDIARKLSVSASTVSRALNNHPKISDATKTRVKEAALEMGYAQSISLALRNDLIGKTIGIVVPSLNKPKYSIMVESARRFFESKGFQVLVCFTSDSLEQEKNTIRLFDNLNLDGVLASLSISSKDPDYYQSLAKRKPLVLFDRISFNIPCQRVMIDHFQAGYRAVQHLLNIGCRKIAHVGGDYNCLLTKQISTGYKTAIRNGGIELNTKLELFSDQIYEDVYKAVEILFKTKNQPDAIIVDDIRAAQKLVSFLVTRQVAIPNQVAILAIGDEQDYSYYSPSITTIQMPYIKMGKDAAGLLLNEIEKTSSISEPETTVIPFNLNIKNSTLKA